MKPAFLLLCLTAIFPYTGIAQEQPGFLQTYCVKVLPREIFPIRIGPRRRDEANKSAS